MPGPSTACSRSSTGDLERSLWTAVRVLEERVALLDRLAERAGQRDHLRARQRYVDEARQATAEARRLRDLLVHGPDEREHRAPAEAVPG